jgi:hypothetical protein
MKLLVTGGMGQKKRVDFIRSIHIYCKAIHISINKQSSDPVSFLDQQSKMTKDTEAILANNVRYFFKGSERALFYYGHPLGCHVAIYMEPIRHICRTC